MRRSRGSSRVALQARVEYLTIYTHYSFQELEALVEKTTKYENEMRAKNRLRLRMLGLQRTISL